MSEPTEPEKDPPKRKRATKKQKAKTEMETALEGMVKSGIPRHRAERILADVIRWRKEKGHI